MGLLIGILTVLLILNCIVLIFLVLIQLPKRETGLGLAFGGSAADALFGPGSGTVLTKATKYTAAVFLGLSFILGLFQSAHYHKSKRAFQEQVEQQAQPTPLPLAPSGPAQPQQQQPVTRSVPAPGPASSGALQPPAAVPAQEAQAQNQPSPSAAPVPQPGQPQQGQPAPAQPAQ
ncbi:MAG: preprotein translocase subunit SecG [Verrucomicrobiae bacterium]|nr:preprotein translocase subunit SecG [Verrucomicrobiae bacterium]